MNFLHRTPRACVGFASLAFVAVAALRMAAAQASSAPVSQGTAPTAAQIEFFETSIRPVLVSACGECHIDDEKGGLSLATRDTLIKGGDSGPAIVLGDPAKSRLAHMLRHDQGYKAMPKGEDKLPEATIAAFETWIADGVPWPAGITVKAAATKPTPSTGSTITAEQRAWWAFTPLAKPTAPEVSNVEWPKTDIDRFVLARLEKEGLAPVRPADKRMLIRRATLDLTGLPPTVEEIEAFEKDDAPDAFAKVVDRLLASPRYGETWGRMWLDVARYGEDDYRSLDPKGRGFNPYPNAYLYRDWVIKAFNDDIPYDQFVRAQLAADLAGDEATRARTLPALGFLGLGRWFYDNGAVEVTRADERHDRVDVVTRGFLGLTVGCARCHDHKYDPIPQAAYYSLAGVFLDTSYKEYPLAPKSVVEEFDQADKKIEKKEKLLDEFLKTESTQLAETLALQASKYMVAAWKVSGEPKEEVSKVVDKDKLDYELF